MLGCQILLSSDSPETLFEMYKTQPDILIQKIYSAFKETF